MAWSTDAARPLAEAFNGALGAPGTVIAVACIDDAGTVIGVNPGDTPTDGRFEVGSVTKTMTATLLALLAADGSLRLDDEVGRWLPAGANAGITVRQLATHTSGLPRFAPNMGLPTVDLANPYAEFGAGQAEEGLRQAVAAPGAPVVYSNFGYQLLGLVLERASGLPYEQLVADRLLTPLGMSRSGVGSNAGGIPLPGHDHRGELPHWERPLAAGGGSRRLSVTWPGTPPPACARRRARSAPPSPRRRRRSSRSRQAGTRPWPGVSATTASAGTPARPAGSPQPCSSTRPAAAQSRCWPAALAASSRCAGRGC
jgi:CubicO group peptidase (beta-lactamase class C family)